MHFLNQQITRNVIVVENKVLTIFLDQSRVYIYTYRTR